MGIFLLIVIAINDHLVIHFHFPFSIFPVILSFVVVIYDDRRTRTRTQRTLRLTRLNHPPHHLFFFFICSCPSRSSSSSTNPSATRTRAHINTHSSTSTSTRLINSSNLLLILLPKRHLLLPLHPLHYH